MAVFGALNLFILLFSAVLSACAILFGLIFLRARRKGYDKDDLHLGDWFLYNLTYIFIVWFLFWVLNAAALYLFRRLPIIHVIISGIEVVQDTADVNDAIYITGILLYLAHFVLINFWVIIFFFKEMFTVEYRNNISLALMIFAFLLSGGTLALFYSICESDTISKTQCWIPGVLYTPYFALTFYFLIFAILIAMHATEYPEKEKEKIGRKSRRLRNGGFTP